MIPAVQVRLWRDNGRAAGKKAPEAPWRTMRILVDRLTCQGFAMHQADTPYLISPNSGQLQDQTEKAP